jgi:hypothetical protein
MSITDLWLEFSGRRYAQFLVLIEPLQRFLSHFVFWIEF